MSTTATSSYPLVERTLPMQRFCFTLDLRPNQKLIDEYVEHHKFGRPEIHHSIRSAGVLDMQIFLLGNRLFMIIDTTDDFTLEAKAAMDKANPAVMEWEQLMARYQDVDPAGNPTSRWQPMQKIFQLA